MRIFQKTHFWRDKRTFMDAEGDLPKLNERGYAEDGNVTIRIGDEEGLRAAFKMTIDEVRSLRDVLDGFIRLNDRRMIKLFKQGREKRDTGRREHDDRERYDKREEHHDRRDDQDRRKPSVEPVELEPAQFSIFDTEEKKKEEPKVKYYY